MKLSTLKEGDQLRCGLNIVWTFIGIEPGQPPRALLQSDACRGLNGPDDQGFATATAAELAGDFVRLPA